MSGVNVEALAAKTVATLGAAPYEDIGRMLLDPIFGTLPAKARAELLRLAGERLQIIAALTRSER